MGLELLPPIDITSFPGLLGRPGDAVDAQGQVNAQNQAMTSALGLPKPRGIAALGNILGIGPTPLDQYAAQQKVAEAQAAQAKAQQADAAVHAMLTTGRPEDAARAMALNPQIAAAIKNAHEVQDEDQQRQAIERWNTLRGVLAAGQTDQARTLLQQSVDADVAAGRDATADKAALVALDTPDGARAVQGMANATLAGIMGSQRFEQFMKGLQPNKPFSFVNTTGGVVRTNQETGDSELVYATPEKPEKPPPGYRWAADGNLEFIPHGPADPRTIGTRAAAGRAPPRARGGGGGGGAGGAPPWLPPGAKAIHIPGT